MAGIASVLALGDLEYANYIAEFIDEMDPATRAHVAVAYQNFIPFISAMHRVSDERGIECTVENVIRDWASEPDDNFDEITIRRHYWFLFAAMLARLEKIGRRTEATREIAATIWTVIITEYPKLKALLPNNVVWTEDEKAWFELSENDQRMMEVGVNFHIPPQFARTAVVERFARDLDLSYWPEKSRIGFVP